MTEVRPTPKNIQVLSDPTDIQTELEHTIDEIHLFSENTEDERLGFVEGFLDMMEDPETVLIKYSCGKGGESTIYTTKIELPAKLATIACEN